MLKLNLNEKETKLLLETLAKAHVVEWMQGKDNSELEKLINTVADALKEINRLDIFASVYQEYGARSGKQ